MDDLEKYRDSVIEECAKMAEDVRYTKEFVEAAYRDGDQRPEHYNEGCTDAAMQIRSLKSSFVRGNTAEPKQAD